MKTVKDFKDAGLVFVNNDIIGCVNSDPDSGGITIGDATRNGELPIHNAWNVREFAWREKTSIMLGFIGKIECINEHGKPLKGPISYYACTKWRPLLKQNTVDVSIETPEEKEALDKIFGADSAPKPSKTVWDAVNKLRGDLSNTDCGFREGNVNLWLNIVENNYISLIGNPFASPEIYELTCTTAEFNALVEEMTLGLDVNGVTHGELFDYVNADKVLLEKETKSDYTSLEFWKDAPKDATHYKLSANDPSLSCWYMAKANLFTMMYRSAWEGTGWHSIDVIDNNVGRINVTFIPRPQPTPIETPEEKEALDSIVNKPLVYTQEMADNGVKPSVGMKAMIKGFEREILLGPDSDGDYITLDANGCYDFDSANQFKPIDQRTKKEKAIDELRNLDDSICNDIKWHANFLQAIIDGKITGVKWVGE